MILQALNTYYQRLLARGEEGLSPFGYSPEKISYEILLAPDGRVVDVNDIRDTSGKKPLPRAMNVPQPEKRTVGIKSNFLWDKTSYVLGASATSKRPTCPFGYCGTPYSLRRIMSAPIRLSCGHWLEAIR